MICVLIKGKFWTQIHTQTPREDEGRDQGHVAKVKEHQRPPEDHQNQGKRHGTDSLSQPSAGIHPAKVLILDFQPPEL